MRVIFDLFPAFVSVAPAAHPLPVSELVSAPPSPGARQIDSCRIVITVDPARVIVVMDFPSGPLVLLNAPYDPDLSPAALQKSPTRATDSHLTTSSGEKLAFRKDTECGCGSRLRSWSPYSVVPARTETE